MYRKPSIILLLLLILTSCYPTFIIKDKVCQIRAISYYPELDREMPAVVFLILDFDQQKMPIWTNDPKIITLLKQHPKQVKLSGFFLEEERFKITSLEILNADSMSGLSK